MIRRQLSHDGQAEARARRSVSLDARLQRIADIRSRKAGIIIHNVKLQFLPAPTHADQDQVGRDAHQNHGRRLKGPIAFHELQRNPSGSGFRTEHALQCREQQVHRDRLGVSRAGRYVGRDAAARARKILRQRIEMIENAVQPFHFPGGHVAPHCIEFRMHGGDRLADIV